MIAADSDYFLLELKPSLIKDAGLDVFAIAVTTNLYQAPKNGVDKLIVVLFVA
jgi:hypothetical protein